MAEDEEEMVQEGKKDSMAENSCCDRSFMLYCDFSGCGCRKV